MSDLETIWLYCPTCSANWLDGHYSPDCQDCKLAQLDLIQDIAEGTVIQQPTQKPHPKHPDDAI